MVCSIQFSEIYAHKEETIMAQRMKTTLCVLALALALLAAYMQECSWTGEPVRSQHPIPSTLMIYSLS